jgi:hypothetical protein
VIRVRRGVVEGIEQETKTPSGERIIDIAPELADFLRQHLAGRRVARWAACFGRGIPLQFTPETSVSACSIPCSKNLGFPVVVSTPTVMGVTILRKNGTPAELQTQWIGHSSLRTTDGYDHTGKEVEYRQHNARKVGLGFVIGPMLDLMDPGRAKKNGE